METEMEGKKTGKRSESSKDSGTIDVSRQSVRGDTRNNSIAIPFIYAVGIAVTVAIFHRRPTRWNREERKNGRSENGGDWIDQFLVDARRRDTKSVRNVVFE